MVRRERKRWEDIAVEQIEGGSENCLLSGFRSENDIEWSVELFISRSAELSPEGFMNKEISKEGWDQIDVPSVWQLQDTMHMHYTDVLYLFPVNPPFVPTENPTGIYKKTIVLGLKTG